MSRINMTSKERLENNRLKEYLRENANKYLITELIPLIYIEFNRKFDTELLRKYLNRNNIPYKKVVKRQFNPQQKEFVMSIAKDYTPRELVEMVNKKFNENYTLKQFHMYLRKHKISYKYEDEKKSHKKGDKPYPIGTEGISYGRVVIKVAPRKWIPKQRYIYEQYHNVKLAPTDYVIFLDGDIHNFDINNLRAVNCRIASIIGNNDLRSKDKQVSDLCIDIANLIAKTKDKEKQYD